MTGMSVLIFGESGQIFQALDYVPPKPEQQEAQNTEAPPKRAAAQITAEQQAVFDRQEREWSAW